MSHLYGTRLNGALLMGWHAVEKHTTSLGLNADFAIPFPLVMISQIIDTAVP